MWSLTLCLLLVCEPLDTQGVQAVAQKLSLTRDQEHWLISAVGSKTPLQPDDLMLLPGSTGELRDHLAAEFCWEDPWLGSMAAGVHLRKDRRLRELRVQGGKESWQVRGRVQVQDSLPAPRGGAVLEKGSFVVVAGHLKWAQGLGLFWTTPGAGQIGSGTRSPARPRPRTSWSMSVENVGLAGRWFSDRLRWFGAVFPKRQSALAGSDIQMNGDRRITLSAGTAGGKWGGAASHHSPWADGQLFVELCHWAGHTAAASAFIQRLEQWTFRGSAHWAQPDYAHPLGWNDLHGGSSWVMEGTWRGPNRNALTLKLGERKKESAPWTTSREFQELGARSPFGSGLKFELTVRKTSTLVLEQGAAEYLFRVDLSRRKTDLVSLRLEELVQERGTLRVLGLRWGRPGVWELRGALVEGAPHQSLRLYRRMPSSIYPWATLQPGAAVGVWRRHQWGPVTAEGSLDWNPTGWESAVSVNLLRTGH